MLNSDIVWPPAILKIIPRDRLPELFDILDVDDSGTVSMEEFEEGFKQLATSQASFKSLHQLRLLSQIRLRQDEANIELKCLHERIKHFDRKRSSTFSATS